MGPWSRAFLDRCRTPVLSDTCPVTDLRIEPALITARVGAETVTLSAPPIPAGIWAAIEPVRADVQSESLLQSLAHTWEEPLIPRHITTVGSPTAVASVAVEVASAIEAEPAVLLRWRGYVVATSARHDAWQGSPLPELPAPARRPPDSVPKRFGASGIPTGHGDLVEALVSAYSAFGMRP